MKRFISITVAWISVATVGCDAVNDAWNNPDLEKAIRQESGRGGKVGTVAALGVRRSARTVADSIESPIERACLVQLSPGEARQAKLVMERTREGDILTRWDETRKLTHGENQSFSYRWTSEFLTLAGTTGSRMGGMIEIDGLVWVARDPGPLWYRADALGGTVASTIEESLDSLLALATWKKDGPRRWTSGTNPLRCSRAKPESGWVARIEANRGTLIRQRFEVEPNGRRSLELEWSLPDSTRLMVTWADQPADGPGEVQAPDAADIVDVERDLSYKTAVESIDRWTAQGLLERTEDESKTASED